MIYGQFRLFHNRPADKNTTKTQRAESDTTGKPNRQISAHHAEYETGEIEVSIDVVNALAKHLDTTPTFILGYETNTAPIRSLADIMNFLFELDKVSSLKFNVDVQKPPRSNEWTCSIRFNGKEMDADHNADMCLFLEQWEEMREDMRSYNCTPAALHSWQEQTLAYYAGASVECVEPEELDEDERLTRRRAYLEKEFGSEK